LNERGRRTVCHFEHGVHSIGSAREHARRFLLDAAPDIPARTVANALLAVSELVTNAVLHTAGPYTLEITLDEDGVRIGVTDTSEVAPVPKQPEYDGSGGLGLHMLRALAGGVDTRLHANGKTVSVVLKRAP
jgi:anti-sigma regulatory factor (Ser/Thr protein kinase)